MKQFPPITMTDALQICTDTFNLTVWGQKKVSIFDDQAIEYGLSQLKFINNHAQPFKRFFDVCTEYSKVNNININWTEWYNAKVDYAMPTNEPLILKENPTNGTTKEKQFYTHKESTINHNDECRQWHEMVINWDSIEDVKKKCAKGYELTYPCYLEWMSKIPLSTLLDQDLPATLLYIDESKKTLLDAMRKQ